MFTAIGFAILALIGITDLVVSDTGRQKVLKQVEKLENQINQVSGLKQDLLDAFQKKDYALANDILISSPFSATYKKLLDDKERINKEFKEKKSRIEKLENEIEVSKGKYSSHSTASGLVGGTLAHLEDAKSDFSADINNLVNGGINTISDSPSDAFSGITINTNSENKILGDNKHDKTKAK